MLKTNFHLTEVLNSATKGCELASAVCEALAVDDIVELDMEDVVRVTPSFANAFVMRVLEHVPDAFDKRRCVFVCASASVSLAFCKAQDRHTRGIVLSDRR